VKFCYLDESGTGGQPVAVMVGVIVDSKRMHLSKEAWSSLLRELAVILKHDLKEFHAHKFYSGAGIWRNLEGETRAQITTAILDWIRKRKHRIVYSAVDTQRFEMEAEKSDELKGQTIWQAMALHIALSIQRHHQRERNNKGHTVLIFDEAVREKTKYTELLLSPPPWTDEYYGRIKGADPLDQLVDVPHFVDSKHVPLVQVADLLAYLLRRHFELETGVSGPSYDDEQEKVAAWSDKILEQSIPKAHIFPKKGITEATQFFRRLAPNCCL
jgi:hypothetical protein